MSDDNLKPIPFRESEGFNGCIGGLGHIDQGEETCLRCDRPFKRRLDYNVPPYEPEENALNPSGWGPDPDETPDPVVDPLDDAQDMYGARMDEYKWRDL